MGVAQHGGDGGCLGGAEAEQPDSFQARAGGRDVGDHAVGGHLAGHPWLPWAEQDRGGSQAAAGVQDAAQPLRGAGIAGGDQRGTRPGGAGCGGGGLRVVAVAEGTGRAGLAQEGGFHLIERRLQRGGHRYARDRGRVLAGEQPGGVSGGDDDRGRYPALGGRGLCQQGCEDRAGRAGRAGTGQAEPAEGSDVEGGLAGSADAERDRAGLAVRRRIGTCRDGAGRCLAGVFRSGGGTAGGCFAVLARSGTGVVVVGVEVGIGGGRSAGDRAGVVVLGACGGGAGGAAQGGDDGGQWRLARLQAARQAGPGAVAAAPLDAGQGERGSDHDRDGDPDERSGRQVHRDRMGGRVRGGPGRGRRAAGSLPLPRPGRRRGGCARWGGRPGAVVPGAGGRSRGRRAAAGAAGPSRGRSGWGR